MRIRESFLRLLVGYFSLAVSLRMVCSGWRYCDSEEFEKGFSELADEDNISIRYKFLRESMISTDVVFE